ncbi:MAG: protein TolQ [Gammaproteobacteria bacterium]
MGTDQSLWFYFINAGLVVKTVMLILLVASLVSWTIIFQRGFALRKARRQLQRFTEAFWSSSNMGDLYQKIIDEKIMASGLWHMFTAGFKQRATLSGQQHVSTEEAMDKVDRAIRRVYNREVEELQSHLPLLASVGSTSPYIGLLGTVWGIMTAFQALGSVQQASIALVAPGIAEALVATAMGLFAAIPAVLAYNRYSHQVDSIQSQYEEFQQELYNALQKYSPQVTNHG